MEGDGESVIAVVQGSKHALTVTLLADHRSASTRTCLDSNRKSTRVSHSSAETNTERNSGNVNLPIYDVRFTNGYRLILGSMFKSPDLFAQSLRKYPIDGSSAEFIQRIIDYTRTRKYGKNRYPRCLRTLLRKTISETQPTNVYKNSSNDEGARRPPALNKDLRLDQNELVNYTYDYLKSSSQMPRNTDVRYLTDMKRAIRGKLRCMVDDEPTVCPRMRSRYSHHRRIYHNKNATINKDDEIEEARRAMVPETTSIDFPLVRNNASSNLVSCQTICKPCLPSCDWYDQQSEELFIKSQDVRVQTFVDEINDWLNTIPVHENFSRNDRIRREELTSELAKTLKSLQKDINFPILAKNEAIKFLDMLPMWRPGDSEYEVVLVERVVDDLIKRLTNVAEEDFKTAISEEVENLPFDTELLKDNIIKETIETFVDKLKTVALNRPVGDEDYKENLKSEVINIIKDLPLRSDKQNDQQILRLAENVVERLHHNNIFKVDSKQAVIENIKKTLFDWCTEVPELSGHNPTQYSDLVQSLADKFQSYEACDMKDDNCVRELRDELEEWLDSIATRLNTSFNSETKYKLSNKLIERLLGTSIIEHVMKWFTNIPDLSAGNSIEMNRALKNIAFQLKEILARNDDVETIRTDMKDIISKWLKHILQTKDMELDPKAQDNLVNDLIVTLTDVPTRKKEQLQSDVVSWLNEIPYLKSHDNFETNNLVRDFVVRIMEIQTDNKDAVEPDIEEEINSFVEQLSKVNDTIISPDYIDELKSKVLTRVKTLPKHKKCCKQFLIEEISNIVESCSMLSKERKEILKNKILSAILKNITDTYIHWDHFFSQLVDMVTQESQLNKNDMETVINRITERINNMLYHPTEEKVCDRTYTSCKICNNSKLQKNSTNYQENKRSILDDSHYYHDQTNHSGNLTMLQNIDLASQNFDQKLEKRKTVNMSLGNTIDETKNLYKTIQTEKPTAIDNETSFLNKNFSTSTPLHSSIKHSSATFIGLPTTTKNDSVNISHLITEETIQNSQYLTKLKSIIRNWLNRLDITMNVNEKKHFVDNIAADIINRLQYLKLSGTCSCEKDELEHLKYQIFKRLHNIVDPEIFRDIMSNVSCLYQTISAKLPNMESLSHKCKQDDILNSLSNSCAQETYIPLQNTSEFVCENLSGAIVDWFRTSHCRNKLQYKIQYYFAAMLAYDIKQVFANCLCSSGDNLNRLLIEEIIKNFRKVSGDLEDSTLCHYACDLLRYLKDLKLFHNISDRKPFNESCNTCHRMCDDDDIVYKYEIKEAAIEWLNGLPLQDGKTFGNICCRDVAQDFIESVVRYSESNVSCHGNLLREHIIRFLSKIPLRVNEQGYSGIEDQAAALTTKIREIYVLRKLATAEGTKPTVHVAYKQLLHDTISKTFFEKCTTRDQFSLYLLKEKLAYAFIDLYSLTDDEDMRIQIKNKLYKEISKFCDDYVKCRSVLHLHSDELQENLHKVLLSVSLPIVESNLDINRDRISEEIRKWVKGVPVCDVMVSILANRIYPILNKPELNNNHIEEINNEIMKWLQSLQLTTDEVLSLEDIVDDLIDNLKVLATFKNVLLQEQSKNNTHVSMKETLYTSNNLRTDEIDHLNRIRARSDIQTSKNTILTSADIGIQTGVKYKLTRSVQTNTTQSYVNQEISPHVIVEEYLWDSIASKPSCHSLTSPGPVPRKTILTTTESQTDSYSKYQIKSQGPVCKKTFELRSDEVSRTIDTQTRITNDLREKRPLLKSQFCQAPMISSEIPKCQQKPFCRMKRNIDCQPQRKTLESEMIHQEYEGECLSISRQPKTTTLLEKLSPVIITEKTSERRCYVSPECIDIRKSKGDNCCNCKINFPTKCRNKPFRGCRQRATGNTLKHCSKCFGGQCPHPSCFFFKRDL